MGLFGIEGKSVVVPLLLLPIFTLLTWFLLSIKTLEPKLFSSHSDFVGKTSSRDGACSGWYKPSFGSYKVFSLSLLAAALAWNEAAVGGSSLYAYLFVVSTFRLSL